MIHRILFLIFLLGSIPFALSAQRYVSGRITDVGDDAPISRAAVFIDNTTIGATTDSEGYYRLAMPGEGSYRLSVSHAGYEPAFVDIEPGKTSKTLDVALHIHEIEAITISVKSNVRKYDVDLFWKTILGQKPSKRTIYATNPDDVYFFFNAETQRLTVTCRTPIEIINNETGYRIRYVLNKFTHDYDANFSSWEGQSLFDELEPANFRQQRTWEKNRQKTYSVSISNFIRSLYHNSLLSDGFLFARRNPFTRKYELLDLEDFLTVDPVAGYKSFYIQPDWAVALFCYGRPVTVKDIQQLNSQRGFDLAGLFRVGLRTTGEPVHIFPDGSYMNPLHITPIFSSKKLSGIDMILPVEYLLSTVGYENIMAADDVDENISEHPLFSLAKRFDEQLSVFPQEKIHLHTDKPYYISGERIWFRAHVVDAATHVPVFSANSVFVELFDAADTVVSRVKTSAINDLYSGYIDIPEKLPEGDYTVRAYTSGMRNLDEDYFFMKNIRIGEPMSRIVHARPEFHFLSEKTVGANIRFSNVHPSTRSPVNQPFLITPEALKISINDSRPLNIKSENGFANFSFDILPNEKQRVMLLDAVYENNPFRQYIRIPLPDDDFDVSFYPEGGSMLLGIMGRVAFKAMQSDGTEIDVDVTVYDRHGNEKGQFKTEMRGMGQFMIMPEAQEETYYAICTNEKGRSKRFELPAAKENGYALSATWGRGDMLTVKALKPQSYSPDDTLFLIVHTRGMVQEALLLENTDVPVVFHKDSLPSGVNSLLLLNKDMVPLSERLVFVNNDDRAKIESRTDKEKYQSRTPVEYTLNITDETGEPLAGNFSVSVTSDNEVAADTTFNILTSLLFTSDLRGYIPDPAYYFRKQGQSSIYSLDLLMLTQGWRRYDTERIAKNDFMYPDTLLTNGYDISGTVRTNVLWIPEANAPVSIISMKGDYADETVADSDGRFYLQDGDVADSTWLMVQTMTVRADRLLNFELVLDETSFPERTLTAISAGMPERTIFAQYADREEQRYVDEHGMRYYLEEIVVTAPRNYSKHYFATDAVHTITDKDIERFSLLNMRSILRRMNILVEEGLLYGRTPVIVVVDDNYPFMDIMHEIRPEEIAQIDLVPSSFAGMFGIVPNIYVLFINLKFLPKPTPYIKYIMPLGIQNPAEFYAPKYDAPQQNTKPDLRTTIHWQPNLTTDDNGMASFSFYTADAPATYTIVIEGITEEGKIIYHKDTIEVVENEK